MNAGICIFGEVLFDHFPDGNRVLGGAPFNVAWHLQAFGEQPHFISRVGSDREGDAIRQAMHAWGMSTRALQTDPQLPTGRVSIQFVAGEPAYDIIKPCAYDAIEPTPADTLKCRLLYHGSLALRDATSRQSAEQLRSCGHDTVFLDVNLRPPWWQREQVLEMVRQANWVKLNDEELTLLTEHHPAPASALLVEYGLDGLVLTHGSRGAELLTADGRHYHMQPQPNINVVDTVGAGDAFASVIILGLNHDWPFELTLQRAQTFASAMVGQRGATVTDPAFYRGFIDDWQLNKRAI
jgi:fructokinase